MRRPATSRAAREVNWIDAGRSYCAVNVGIVRLPAMRPRVSGMRSRVQFAPVLPPSKILQAMLRKITERFARELADPAPLAPEWSEFEWIVARAVAAMHGISPLLS